MSNQCNDESTKKVVDTEEESKVESQIAEESQSDDQQNILQDGVTLEIVDQEVATSKNSDQNEQDNACNKEIDRRFIIGIDEDEEQQMRIANAKKFANSIEWTNK